MPLLWLALSFVCGVWLASLLALPVLVWAGFLLLLYLAWLSLPSLRGLRVEHGRLPLVLMAAALVAGGARFAVDQAAWQSGGSALEEDMGAPVLVDVEVVSLPELWYGRLSMQARLRAMWKEGTWQPTRALIAITIPRSSGLEYGSRARLSGVLRPVLKEDEDRLEDYGARQGVQAVLSDAQVIQLLDEQGGSSLVVWLASARAQMADLLARLCPYPESTLLMGVLLGLRGAMPDMLYSAYKGSGLAHIVVVSGFNLALLAGVVTVVLRRWFRPGMGTLLAGAVIVGYALLVGGKAPVTRAALMALIALPAWWLGRRATSVNSLGLAAALMVLVEPLLLWDVSFQLSFSATLGLVLLADPLADWMAKLHAKARGHAAPQQAGIATQFVAACIAAPLACFPFSAAAFGVFNPFALPANLLILPLQPAMMAGGFFALFLGMLAPTLGRIAMLPVWLLAHLSNLTAMFLGFLPISRLPLPRWLPAVSVPLLLILAGVGLRRILRRRWKAKTGDD